MDILDHQYRENCETKHIFTLLSDQSLVEQSSNWSKNDPLSTLPLSNRRNFEDSRKVLALSVSEFYQSNAYMMVVTTVCVQKQTCDYM